jgi:hypothetical protein
MAGMESPSHGPASRDDAAAAAASLQVMADHVDRYHEEVGACVPAFQGDEHGDAATALVEAERALRTAARLLRRAARLLA